MVLSVALFARVSQGPAMSDSRPTSPPGIKYAYRTKVIEKMKYRYGMRIRKNAIAVPLVGFQGPTFREEEWKGMV